MDNCCNHKQAESPSTLKSMKKFEKRHEVLCSGVGDIHCCWLTFDVLCLRATVKSNRPKEIWIFSSSTDWYRNPFVRRCQWCYFKHSSLRSEPCPDVDTTKYSSARCNAQWCNHVSTTSYIGNASVNSLRIS